MTRKSMMVKASAKTLKTAWVTGGATGIGLATAEALARAGFRVVISGRRKEVLHEAVMALREKDLTVEALVLDVAKAAQVARVAAKIGVVDVLVCSAGVNVPNRMWGDLTPEAFAKVTAINLNGVAYCVGAVLPGMRQRRAGQIVVVSSWAGWRFTAFTGAAYGATKSGLASVVESLNEQEGRHGVRACFVAPGEVATPILKSRPVPPSEADMARMLKAEDVADAIAYVVAAPPHVCLNELVISPTWNRIYMGAEDFKRATRPSNSSSPKK
jgi:NADP-dependent 3-hydroxy acid dehydrogenase YdfG